MEALIRSMSLTHPTHRDKTRTVYVTPSEATNPVAYPGDSAENRWRQHLGVNVNTVGTVLQ